jgi:ATP-dependent Clp protease ATP-binding subunit ClpA/post-segregation antitoxin (ccd killing protein)
MPKINVYLPDDLAETVKDIDLPVSAICQRALELAVRRVTAMREVTRGTLTALPDYGGFTDRCLGMVESAMAAARDASLPGTGTEHLLAALAADENGLALRVLNAMEITGAQLRSALAGRADASPATDATADPAVSLDAGSDAGPDRGSAGAPGGGARSAFPFGPYAAAAMHLAAAESAGLGHNYIGSEHILLGLIGEPDGVAGSVLRSLGAELRVTRRTVAALAGWAARTQRGSAPGATLAAQISSAVRAELAPVVSRIERLERVTAG